MMPGASIRGRYDRRRSHRRLRRRRLGSRRHRRSGQLTQRAAGTPITMAAPAAAEEPGAEEAAGFFFDDVDVLPEQKEARKANSVKLKQRPAAVRLTAPADRASSARKSPLLLRNLIRHAGGGLAAFRRSVPPAAS